VNKKTPGTQKAKSSKPTRKIKTSSAARTKRAKAADDFEPDFPEAPPPPSVKETQRHRDSREAALAAIGAALDKKALMPALLDVSGQATYTDFIGVVSGRSDRQVDAIAENVREVMQQRGWRLLGREGTRNGRWTLLDFGDVVVHVFYHPVREIYDIEGLWIDAPRIPLEVPPEAQLYQSDALYGAL
jgi:ribosome-associated protein